MKQGDTSTPQPLDPVPVEDFSELNREMVTALRDDDDAIRRMGLTETAEALDDELAAELLRLLHGEGDEVFRGDVAVALGPSLELCDLELDPEGRIPDTHDDPMMMAPLTHGMYQRVTEDLHAVYADASYPKLVRRRALESAVRSPKPWQEAAARAAWASDDPEWRATAVFCMGLLHHCDFAEEIAAALHCDEDPSRYEAIVAAGHRAIEALGPEIRAIALDEEAMPELRYVAVEAMPTLAVKDAGDILLELSNSDDERMSEAAENALEELTLVGLAEAFDEELDEFGDDILNPN